MKIVRFFIVLIFSLIGLVFLIPLFLPAGYTVEVREKVEAPSHVILHQVSGIRNWQEWWPGEKDTTLRWDFETHPDSRERIMNWEGESAGKGRVTLLDTAENEILTRMEFIGPWESHARGYWNFEDTNSITHVKWTVEGNYGYLDRYIRFFSDHELKKQLQQGMQALKERSERISDTLTPPSKITVEFSETSSKKIVEVPKYTTPEKMTEVMAVTFNQLDSIIRRQNAVPGRPGTIYYHFDRDTAILGLYVPFDSGNVWMGRPYKIRTLKGGPVLKITHTGPYSGLEKAYNRAMAYLKENDLKQEGPFREIYVNNPDEVPPAQIRTIILMPLE